MLILGVTWNCLASVYQSAALVCSFVLSSLYWTVSEEACPHESVCVCACACVSSLQERREMLLQFSHCSIYLQWLSLCNSECIFVHWIWIYIWLYMYETWKWRGFIVLTTVVAVEMKWICFVGVNLTQLCTICLWGERIGGFRPEPLQPVHRRWHNQFSALKQGRKKK